MDQVMEWLNIAAIVVAGASSVVLGLEKFAGITSSTKDDERIGKAKKALAWVSEILSKIALNPKK